MTPACIRQTELPHSSRLFTDFLYAHNRVAPYYQSSRSREGFGEERRAAVVEALQQSNAPGAALDRLSQKGTVAVVTGQQVGLFSGPAYTIFKALTAAKHAQYLTGQGTPAVPVFWLATEDHDFEEVNHSWVFDPDNQPVGFRVNGREENDQPVGGIQIERWPVDALRQAFRGFPFGDDVAVAVEKAYQPGASLGEAFRSLLETLLEPYGFLFVDPMRPEIRRLAAPLIQEAIYAGPDLTAALLARNKELDSAGYHAQVHIEEKTSLFFVIEDGRRVHLRRVGREYLGGDRRWSVSDLAEVADSISPNALLRPVVQDYLLPTAAYVGGPAELAYFAQSQVLYEQLSVPMPRMLSRTGFTLLDLRTAKLMDRYKLRIHDFFHGEEMLREKVAGALTPPGMQQHFETTNSSVAQKLDELRAEVFAFDPTLGSALDKSRAKILSQLQKIEAKAAREIMRRDERAQGDARYLYNGIFPHKHLQERFYSILPFLARHGFDLMDQLYEAVPLECPDHIVLPVAG